MRRVSRSFLRAAGASLALALVLAALLAAGCGGSDGDDDRPAPTTAFDKYGFSFRYPDGWSVKEEGALGQPPSAESGAVTVSSTQDASAQRSSVLRVWWVKSAETLGMETVFEAYLSSMRASKEVQQVSPGEAARTEFRGQPMIAADWRVRRRGGREAYGRVASFQCGTHTFLAATLDSTTTDAGLASKEFQAYLESFTC